jgi:thiol:disulfide interchange protein DsbD
MKPVLRSLIRSAIYLSIFAIAQPGEAQTYEGKELVKPELLADTTAVVPGKEFTVALLLRMAPGWHTYWHSPGDAGLPTEVKWKLPPGWTEHGALQWPIPLKTTDPGDIQTYGYENEVLLMQQITTPAKIDNEKVTLSAEASWLVCEKICIPGSATLQLGMPVAPGGAPSNSAIFSRYRQLLPHQWPKEQIAKAEWTRTDADLRLKIISAIPSKYSLVDFYPAPPPNATIGHPQIEKRDDNAVIFRIPVESPKDLSAIPGLVVLAHHADGSDRTAWQLELPPARAAAAMGNARGVIAFLFFGFIGGFILNLMPCVLPVISLKIFGFIQQAGQSRRKIFRSGVAFVAGIFAWFIGLALVLIGLKAAGRDVTWGGFQFTNAYFVLVLSVVVLVFALNLFGVFEFSLPQTATRGLLGWSAREGDLGSFFQGVFATVLATPCSAPFLGTALGFAFAQSASVILLMFIAIAAGMGAPYLLLSAQPAWLRFLPKPGPWMLRVKEAMGFLLLATLLFLLYVLGAQRGLAGAIWASCFLLAAGIACWIKGAFLTPTASAKARVIAAVTICARRATRAGRRDLGELFSARSRHRLLDQGRVFNTDRFGESARHRGGNDVDPARAQRRLLHRQTVSLRASRSGSNSVGRLAAVHPRTIASRARPGPRRVYRFYRGLVSHLQIQRAQRTRERGRARRVPNPRRDQIESRLDQRRSDNHEIVATIWPAGCPIIRALSGAIGSADCLSRVVDQKYVAGKTWNTPADSCRKINL